MPKSLDDLYEAALAAAEAREEALRKRGLGKKKPAGKLKAPCPAERTVLDEGRLHCRSKKEVGKVKVGPWKAELDAKRKVKRPEALKGIRGDELRALDRDLKTNRQHQKDCGKLSMPVGKQTFANPGAALSALFSANPGLGDAIYRIWGSKIDGAYTEWVQRGMRGPRPTVLSVYGTAHTENLPVLDFISGFTDKAGRKRKIYSVTEALYASAPASRRWEDWLPVLEALQEEINRHAAEDDYIRKWHEIKIPGRAGAALERRRDLEAVCKHHEPRTTSEIVDEYRRGKRQGRDEDREPGADEGGDVPF
jgi:hypothetical protein